MYRETGIPDYAIDLGLRLALDIRIQQHREDERLEGSDGLREINLQLLSPSQQFTHGVSAGDIHRPWDHLRGHYFKVGRVLVEF